jgi:nucleotide-binding universal stress UspA family protein
LRGAGRFYPQTASEAAAVPDEALPMIWACALKATTAVVRAPRAEVAAAIAQQASAWRADVIVMTRRPDQVMRKAHCPVLAVHPGPKVTRNASR